MQHTWALSSVDGPEAVQVKQCCDHIARPEASAMQTTSASECWDKIIAADTLRIKSLHTLIENRSLNLMRACIGWEDESPAVQTGQKLVAQRVTPDNGMAAAL